MGKNNFNNSRGDSGRKFNQNQSKFKSPSRVDRKSQNPHHKKSQSHQNKSQNLKQENNQHGDKRIDENDSKKVHYVLNPKALRRKIQQLKEGEQSAKEKAFLDKSKILIFR
jgi:hypothetical protein